MQSYLIVSQNKIFIDNQIAIFRKKFDISPFNYHEILPSPSTGIDEIRNLKKLLTLKPFSAEFRLIIIREIHKATVASQNALLKILEEPRIGTYIILTCPNENQLLPTVVSRCQLITDKGRFTPSEDNILKMKTLLEKIISTSAGGRIIISQQYSKTKEDTLAFLDDLINTLESFLHLEGSRKDSFQVKEVEIAAMLKKTIAAKRAVEGNVNYKAVIDILFLGFPKHH